jgi:hypothetical protein
MRAVRSGVNILARSSKARLRRIAFSLDKRLRRKSHVGLDRALYGSDLHGVAETSKLPNQGALALLNCVQITAAGAMLYIANLLMEDLPDEPEQAMSNGPDCQFHSPSS